MKFSRTTNIAGLRAERDAYQRRAETAECELATLKLLRAKGPSWLKDLIVIFGWQDGTWTEALHEIKKRSIALAQIIYLTNQGKPIAYRAIQKIIHDANLYGIEAPPKE